jgi:tetratricopeptide (TPR) repeat protein
VTSRRTVARTLGIGVAVFVIAVGAILLRPDQKPGISIVARDDPASPVLGADADARALMTQAEQVLNRGDDAAAEQLYGQALALYRQDADVAGQGTVFLGLGRMEHFTGQSDRARDHFDEAGALFRRSGSMANEAQALAARADLEKDTFNWVAAGRFYREARAVWQAAPEPKHDSHVVFRMDEVPQLPEGEDAARAILEQAQLIFENVGDPEALGDIRVRMAFLDWNTGLPGVARGNYATAQALYRQSGTPDKEAASALEGARIDIFFGQNRAAKVAIDQALAAYVRAENEAGAAIARMIEGDLERLQGQMAAARQSYASAAEVLREAAHPEAATALMGLGQVETHLGAAESARGALEEAADLYRVSGSAQGEAAAALALGRVIAEKGDPAAGTLFATAAEQFRKAGDSTGEARAHLEIAALALSRGETDLARASYEVSAARFIETDAALGRVLASLGLGDVAQEAGDADGAAAAYRSAMALFASLDTPIAEANRILGLPPISELHVRLQEAAPFAEGVEAIEVRDPGDSDYNKARSQALLEQANLENSAAFPNHNAEARALLIQAEARLAASEAFVLGLN